MAAAAAEEVEKPDGACDLGVVGGLTKACCCCPLETGVNDNLCPLLCAVFVEGAVTVLSPSSVRLLIELVVPETLLAEGLDSPSSTSRSSPPAPMMGLSSMISVRRLLFLLEFMVDVEVEFVRRAMLSKVMSLGVLVSSRKSLSRK